MNKKIPTWETHCKRNPSCAEQANLYASEAKSIEIEQLRDALAGLNLHNIASLRRIGDFGVSLRFASVRACSAFIEATGITPEPSTISADMLQAVREASESGATAGEHAGQVFFLNKGTELAHDPAQDCPACGGSGHKDDNKDIPAGQVVHYAAPANLPVYASAHWYGKPPANGAKLYLQPQPVPPFIPTETQILAATEKAGLWPNTVYTWLPAFHRYHAELAKLQSQANGGN